MDSSNPRRARAFRQAALLVAFALALGSCAKNDDFRQLWDIESRSQVGAPPQSVEDLKAAIRKYAAEADRTVAADEKVGTYYKLLLIRYLDRSMYLEAYEAAVKALEYFPANAAIFYNAAHAAGFVAKSKAALGKAGEAERARWLDIAESSYKRAIEGDPTNVRAYFGLAVLYEFELDRPEEAEPLLRQVLSREPKNLDSVLLLARVLYRLGKLEEAADLYGTAAAMAPSQGRMSSGEDKKKAAEENRDRILREIDGRK